MTDPNSAETRREILADLLKAERAARTAAEQTEHWLQPIRDAAGRAITTLSLDEVLGAALSAVAALLGADAAAVLITDETGRMLVARAAVGLAKGLDRDVRIEAGRGVAGRILAERRPMIFADLADVQMESPVLRDSGARSLAGLPLEAGGDAVGVMHISSRRPGVFAETDLAVLEVLAEPIASAIQRVRLFEAERAARLVAETAVERLQGLQRITAALAAAANPAEVCAVILEESSVGARGAGESERGIWMVRGGRLVLVAGGKRSSAYPEIPLDDSMPGGFSLRTGEPLFIEAYGEMVERWPALAEAGTRAFAGLALRVGQRPIGVMAVGYGADHRFDDSERAYLVAVAEQAALALDRAVAREQELAEQERQGLLAEAAIALSKQYTAPELMLQDLTELAVPRLGDSCAVLILQRGVLEQVARASVEGEGIAHVAVNATSDEPVARVLRSGTPVIDSSSESLEAARGYPTSTMIVPLTAHGRPIGVMTFDTLGTHPPYEEADLELASKLAERVSAAAEDVIVRQRDRALAAALTRALLPTRFPSVHGVEFAARYVPADAGPVGGDWYDAFELPDGKLGIVIGDVAGHGVEAASTMGRLRNGVFAYAREGHSPQMLFERLANLLADPAGDWESTDPLATVLYAVFDRERGEITTACAGHPPWLMVRNGRHEYVKCTGRVLVPGLEAMTEVQSTTVKGGDILLFFTDGLVERAGEPLEVGLDRLGQMTASLVRPGGSVDLEVLCDALLEQTTPENGRRDDCCLLAVRIG